MRLYVTALVIFIIPRITEAQDSLKRFQFGPTLITMNVMRSYGFPLERPFSEYMSGLFFRYTQNRIGFRAHANYSEYFYAYDSSALPHGWYESTENKEVKLGIGVQYSLLKKGQILYSFFDLIYRNRFTKGYVRGGYGPYNYTSSTNGMDSYIGIGSGIKISKNVMVSPELSYTLLYYHVNRTTQSSAFVKPSSYIYINLRSFPGMRIHMTINF
jgi:hypothetical protein